MFNKKQKQYPLTKSSERQTAVSPQQQQTAVSLQQQANELVQRSINAVSPQPNQPIVINVTVNDNRVVDNRVITITQGSYNVNDVPRSSTLWVDEDQRRNAEGWAGVAP